MNINFDIAFDGVSVAIPYFDLSSFTSMDTVPPKAQHVLVNSIFNKSVQDMDVKFDMITK